MSDEMAEVAVELLAACKAQHEAMDRLFAMLIVRDPRFFPSECGQPWEAMLQGNKAIERAKGMQAGRA